jgi:hypothetical protein
MPLRAISKREKRRIARDILTFAIVWLTFATLANFAMMYFGLIQTR